ncbi:LysR family transcriptional regulator [Paenibacillus sp. S3N08]|uniref:LysR family transcriptional regulator n=2 Tax=Paenibacillus agricola TaxID=2716264 RepID=A0ABX0J8V3_9BACL|nr:LysR family transcriptional regulator [Paenibacillus agricola]
METFIVLAECSSFTETAKRLFCSQPTISNHIQHLEELFKTTLFLRTGKSVQLTKQGEVLLEYAKQMTFLVEEAAIKIKKVSQQDSVLSVYVSNYIAGYFFSDILSHFHTEFPKQLLEIYTYCYDDLVRCLREGRTNVAFMPIYQEDEYIRSQYDITVLFEDDFPLILPIDHAWSSRKVLYCRDLHNETILLPQSPYLQQYITKQVEKQHVKVRFLQMSNFEMIKQAVKSKLGIAFLPYTTVINDIKHGGLQARSVSSLNLTRTNGFAVRKNTKLTPAETAFCQDVERYFLTSRNSLLL